MGKAPPCYAKLCYAKLGCAAARLSGRLYCALVVFCLYFSYIFRVFCICLPGILVIFALHPASIVLESPVVPSEAT